MYEALIQDTNKLYREDPFVRDFYFAIGLLLDELLERLEEAEKQLFFDTMTEVGIDFFERYLLIQKVQGASLEERRQNVQANWLATKGKKFTIQMAQEVAAAWDNGAIKVDFLEGKIYISFLEIYGVPKYIDQITATLENIKPAHLPLYFIYRTHSWRDLLPYTWGFAAQKTWETIGKGAW